MSHITASTMEVKDVDCLEEIAPQYGLEFVRGKKKYTWFGRYVGDTQNTTGLQPSQFGHCEHALVIKGGPKGAYEIGVVKNPNGEGYVLHYDTWDGKLEPLVGKDCSKLKQAYSAAVLRKTTRQTGGRLLQETEMPNGWRKLVVAPPRKL